MESADPARDTIAAIATPAGRGGIGVVRISGPGVLAIATALIGRLPIPRHVTLVVVRDRKGEQIEGALAIYFPAPASYTGEPVLELQGHGSPVALGSVLAACIDAGARLAEAGEFTRRAFLNGKMDLAQAEAVADLIEAATARAAREALRSLSGEFSAAIDALVRQLTDLRALTEATLDFPEEEIDAFHREDMRLRLAEIRNALAQVLKSSRQGSLLRSGINVVLAGRPNVGKSSLLNRLAGEERAIVAPMPGTTRDAVRETISIEGVPLNIVDTAGLHATTDEIERLGIERTWRELGRADLVVMMVDAVSGLLPEDQAILERFPDNAKRVRVWNKIDLAGLAPGKHDGRPDEVFISAKTGAGIDALREVILETAGWDHSGESLFVARERQLRALAEAGDRLDAAAAQHENWEFFAEELRLAQLALAGITGEFSADDLLGEIFSRFCIGK